MTNSTTPASSTTPADPFAVLATDLTTIVLDALRLGSMTLAQAFECYTTNVRLYGVDDADSVAYQRAITRHLS